MAYTDTPATIGTDQYGCLATSHGVVYRLTPCCKASTKGTEVGTVCRACYQPVDTRYTEAWMLLDDAAWDQYAETGPTTDVDAMRQQALRLGTTWDVTWGMGGPNYTATDLCYQDARELHRDLRAWGTVMRPSGTLPWQQQQR